MTTINATMIGLVLLLTGLAQAGTECQREAEMAAMVNRQLSSAVYDKNIDSSKIKMSLIDLSVITSSIHVDSLPSNDGAERDLFEVTIQSMTEKLIGKYLVSINTYKNQQTNSTFCDFRGITKIK